MRLFLSIIRSMDWLNYHHLLYFWTTARTGSIAAASKELSLASPTISAQIRLLEENLGEKLFTKSGRNLELTEAGHVVYRYGEEIFSLGKELRETLKGQPSGRPLRLRLGVVDVLPKRLAYRLIEPVLHLPYRVQVMCREERPERLLALLAVNELDGILSDVPTGPTAKIRAFNHLLGECGVGFYGVPKLAAECRRPFPQALARVPWLLPAESAAIRRNLDQWFDAQQIDPTIVGEFDDYSLLLVFAQAGHGIFAAPSILDKELRKELGFVRIGRASEVTARYYVISVEKAVKHPAIAVIRDSAREETFA